MSTPADIGKYCPSCGAVYSADTEFCPKDGAALNKVERILAGRYVLCDKLGSGNMGTVYRSIQLPMRREVAVKVLNQDLVKNPDMVARFEREALAASTVDHPNAITIYDSGRTDDNQVYIAMEYLQGETLTAIIRREGWLPPSRALDLWVPVVKAMVVAHRKGVVHRDLKPDNIFIAKKTSETEEGQVEELVKVLDFGIAKLVEGSRIGTSKTIAGMRIGTALYMSPEQLEGHEVGKHTDVYALGLILVEMLTGRLPWGKDAEDAESITTMMRLVSPPIPLVELRPELNFSPELQQLINSLLAISPKDRPSDAGELLRRMVQVPEAGAVGKTSPRKLDISQVVTASSIQAIVPAADDASTELQALPTVVTGRSSKSTDSMVSVKRGSNDALNRDSSGVSTLPQPVPAPSVMVSSSPEPALTQPMPVARAPRPAETARIELPGRDTMDVKRWSSVTLRDEPAKVPILRIVALGILAVVLVGMAYFFLKTPPPVTITRDLSPAPDLVREASAIPSVPVEPSTKPGPTESPDLAKPSAPRSNDPPISVSFRPITPKDSVVVCGSEVLSACTGICKIAPGEQCQVRREGYSTARYPYDDLKAAANKRGKAKLAVKLSPIR